MDLRPPVFTADHTAVTSQTLIGHLLYTRSEGSLPTKVMSEEKPKRRSCGDTAFWTEGTVPAKAQRHVPGW